MGLTLTLCLTALTKKHNLRRDGHNVGSLRTRVELQNSGKYEKFVMIADLQALTDNANNPQKIRDSILEVFLDYIAAGLEIDKTRFFLQSQVPALFELPMYFSNLVTLSTLQRNPTIKNEIKMRGFNKSIPVGFLTYPISQTADITAFKARQRVCKRDHKQNPR